MEGKMNLIHVKGNTWCLVGWQLIPIYMVDDHHCVLLDTGLYTQYAEIEHALEEKKIVPVGIIATHAHTDHAGGLFYFQRKYNIPVWLPVGEAGLLATELDLKVNFYVFPVRECREAEDVYPMQGIVKNVILPEDNICTVAGATFSVVHLPGHSADHVAIGTPDHVLYVGDAILAGDDLKNAKLPYYLSVEYALESMNRLKEIEADIYVCAHNGIYHSISEIVDSNIVSMNKICDTIEKLIDHPMTLSEVQQKICMEYNLRSSNLRKAELYERSVRGYVEYLQDSERILVFAKDGVIYYAPRYSL